MKFRLIPGSVSIRNAVALSVITLLVCSGIPSGVQAAAGDLDPTFGVEGRVTTDFSGQEDVARAIAIRPDGKIIVGGTVQSSLSHYYGLARYNPDGSLDTSFGSDGKVAINLGQAYALALQPDGKILIGGISSFNFAIDRYNSDGSPDMSFGVNGRVFTDFFGREDTIRALAVQADGKIVAAGFGLDRFGVRILPRFTLARFNSDGSLDSDFGTGGKIVTDFSSFGGLARAVLIQSDGRIIAAGGALLDIDGFAADFALARYNSDGSLDADFGTDGKVRTDFFHGADMINSLVVQPDGKIIAAGSAHVNNDVEDDFALARYNPDGSLDLSFGTGGKTTTHFGHHTPPTDTIEEIALGPDGRIVAAGYSYKSGFDFALARYNSNGVLDTSFGTSGKVLTDYFTWSDQGDAIAILPDGRIVVAGYAHRSDTVLDSDFAIARYDWGLFDTCAFTLDHSSRSFAAGGGAGSFSVITPEGCDWTSASNDDWVTITSGDAGSGNGTINYSVASNPGFSIRNGTITVAGQTFTVLQGINFNDVTENHPFYTEIGKLSARGVTLGCDAGNYCPDDVVTRQQMAAFIMRALGEFNPPTPPSQRFSDVPPTNPFYAFIEQMAIRQITLGCSANMYCPTDPVLRDQMAAFIIRALHPPGYIPPLPAMQRFPDVPPTNAFYAHIEEMAVRQITLGCGGGNYCPSLEVSRGQMAAFLVRAFNL